MDIWIVGLLSVLIISVCAVSSYWRGRNEGLVLGIEKSLDILMHQKIVHIDEKNEIHQYDSEIAKRAREKYIVK